MSDERQHAETVAREFPPGSPRTMIADIIERERAGLLARAEAAEAAHAGEIEAWQMASGLLRGGDPSDITPEDLSRETQSKSRLLFEIRDHLRLVLGELGGNTLEASTLLLLDQIEKATDGE